MDYDIGLRFFYWADATDVLFINKAVRPTSLLTIIIYTKILIIRCRIYVYTFVLVCMIASDCINIMISMSGELTISNFVFLLYIYVLINTTLLQVSLIRYIYMLLFPDTYNQEHFSSNFNVCVNMYIIYVILIRCTDLSTNQLINLSFFSLVHVIIEAQSLTTSFDHD